MFQFEHHLDSFVVIFALVVIMDNGRLASSWIISPNKGIRLFSPLKNM